MDPSAVESAITSNVPAIVGIMATCLLIIVIGAVARAVSQALGGGERGDDD